MIFYEMLVDEPGFFRLERLGKWYHIFDYMTGTGEWYFDKLPETLIDDSQGDIALPVRGKVA